MIARETARVRYKLRGGRVAFVRVESATTPAKDWLELDANLSLVGAPAWLAFAYGFADGNTARRLIVELCNVEGVADELRAIGVPV